MNPMSGRDQQVREFFTYLVALGSCARRRDVEVVDGEHTLSLQARCTGFMGSCSSPCRDMLRCCVKVTV